MANYENIRPYADFAHTAAQNGGVKNYLDQIAESNYDLGRMNGEKIGALKEFAYGAVVLIIWEGGKWVYRKGRRLYEERRAKRRNEDLQKSEAAKKAIIQGVKEAEAAGLVDEAATN